MDIDLAISIGWILTILSVGGFVMWLIFSGRMDD